MNSIEPYRLYIEGFEDFKNHGIQEIRESLRRLLSQNKVVTKVSKKGNTIYRIK